MLTTIASAVALLALVPQAVEARTHSRSRAGDIVDVAAASPNLKTLVAAVKAAGLVGTLKGRGPFTVFAPTDAAFARLPKGTLESLLKPENKAKLASILTYHVLPGRIAAAAVRGKHLTVRTVQGQTVRVNGRHGVRVNNARVVAADVGARNGVVHIIDRVLLPRS